MTWTTAASCAPALTPTRGAQVDLQTASLRPGRDSAWLGRLTERLMAQVAASGADITVHCSTWQHDLDQVGALVWGNCSEAADMVLLSSAALLSKLPTSLHRHQR